MTEDRLLTLEDVASRLRMSYHRARVLVLDPESGIAWLRVGARGIRVEEAQLNRYIEGLKVNTPAGGA